MLRAIPFLWMVILLTCVSSLWGQESVSPESRRQALQHRALLEDLNAQLEAESDEAARAAIARELAVVRLEAELLGRVVPLGELAAAKPKRLFRELVALEMTPPEQLTLARFAFLQGEVEIAEEALGQARDGDEELAAETNRILADARGEAVPEGGYFRYRGRWLALAERDLARALDDALAALDAVEHRESLVPFPPLHDEPNRERFEELGRAGATRLARAA